MRTIPAIACIAVFGFAIPSLLATPVLAPNGDFSAGAAFWGTGTDGPTVFDFPASGGNPDGFGRIDFTTGNYAVLVSPAIPIGDLGLTAGETYEFSLDMINLDGAGPVGGLKIDFPGATPGSTGDKFTELIGDGSTWQKYTFAVPIPANAVNLVIVPLWGGPNSNIGYDNIGVDNDPVAPPPVLPVVPNAGFESGSASWAFFSDGPTVSYPATGGNPAGHALIDATVTPGSFAVLVANGNAPQTLASLGLSAGETYTFQLDMKLFSGPNIGGIKVEFVPGFSGDLRPTVADIIALPNPVTEWNTYSFDVPIPPGTTQIQVVPLWGPNSLVGYDNVKILVPTPDLFQATIEKGTVVSWTPGDPASNYQPQESSNGLDWNDLGPRVAGDSVTTRFDADGAAAYRVLEKTVSTVNALLNGGFETPNNAMPTCPESWACLGTQPPVITTTDFFEGTAAVSISVVNDAGATANTSEIQQNILASGGSIVPGNNYDFSFRAKQISSGVSYVQQYRVQWLDAGSGILAGPAFQNFTGGAGQWDEISLPGLVAPAGAVTALVQIYGATGAVAGATASGGVLVDDIQLVSMGEDPSFIDAAQNGSFEVQGTVDPLCADLWNCGGTQPPSRLIGDAHGGGAFVQMLVDNLEFAVENTSEFSQDFSLSGGFITEGDSYTLSFWAKQISNGSSYQQQYRLEWRNNFDEPLPGGIVLTPFLGGDNEWVEITVPDLVAPAEAYTAYIEFVASTTADASSEALGEVHLDDLSFTTILPITELPVTAGDGIGLSWQTEAGASYQVKAATGLSGFTEFGPAIIGDGSTATVTDLISGPRKFYQVEETAAP